MKNYELIIEKFQPSCGGRPYLHNIFEVKTDDPIAYVKTYTKNARLEIDNDVDDSMVIIAEEGDYRTKFVFSTL